jgi:hypothetical protein
MRLPLHARGSDDDGPPFGRRRSPRLAQSDDEAQVPMQHVSCHRKSRQLGTAFSSAIWLSPSFAVSLLFALALALCASAVGSNIASAGPALRDAQTSSSSANSKPADAKGFACVWTIEQFVPELDAVMMENPKSILKYHALLAKYLFLNNGIPGLPPPLPSASIEGCNIDRLVELAKRSKFFFEATEVSRDYLYYLIEFRSPTVKAGFAVEKATGNIVLPYAKWTTVYP